MNFKKMNNKRCEREKTTNEIKYRKMVWVEVIKKD